PVEQAGHLPAERPRRLRGDAAAAAGAAGHALAAGTTAHAELQVLLLREGPGHLLGSADGEGELAAGLAHGDGGADVVGADLHVPAGAALPNGQAAPARPRATVDGAVLEGCRDIVQLGLVDLLVDAFLHRGRRGMSVVVVVPSQVCGVSQDGGATPPIHPQTIPATVLWG
uniref:Uncharacterized protein n=1 Tax=Taeniopygia guttata TaxID=59729 RepID=A0A674GW06_TAEGU